MMSESHPPAAWPEPYAPHAIDDRAYWDGVIADPAKARWLTEFVGDLADVPDRAELPTAADFLARDRFNDRSRVDHFWQASRVKLLRLTLNRLMRGIEPEDADDRLMNWLFDVTFQPTWTNSSHLRPNDLPVAGFPVLDLASCEFAGIMAETLELLRPWIDASAKTLSASIVHEIDRRVLTPFAEGFQVWWDSNKRTNNWAGVCAGSILAACQALARQGELRADAETRAIRVLNQFFANGFTADGESDEGVGYWRYGVEMACWGLSCLRQDEIEQHFDVARICEAAAYPGKAHLFGNAYYCGNDSASHCVLPPLAVLWLGRVCGDEHLLSCKAAPAAGKSVGTALRCLQYWDLADERVGDAGNVVVHPARMLKDQQVGIFQRRLGDDVLSVTMTGGDNNEQHNHNHLGTIQVWINDEVIVPDMGAPQYTADFFGPRRYTYLPACSRGHCCPMVNGFEQRPGHLAAGAIAAWDPAAGTLSLDLTAAYPGEAYLKRWIRTLNVPNDTPSRPMTLSDEFSVIEGAGSGEIVHRIWSIFEPVMDGEYWALGRLLLKVHPKPAVMNVSTFSADELRLKSLKGRSLYRLEWTYRADARGEVNVTTEMRVR